MAILKTILRIIDSTSLWVGKGASFLIFFAMCILVYEVASRYLFHAPTLWAHEIARHLYGAQFMLGGAFGLLLGTHVVSDVIVSRLSPRRRAVVDALFSVVFFFFCYMLFVRGAEMAIESIKVMERAQGIFRSPVWPVRLTIPIGGLLIGMQGLAKLVRDIHLAVTGEKLQ